MESSFQLNLDISFPQTATKLSFLFTTVYMLLFAIKHSHLPEMDKKNNFFFASFPQF